LLEIELSRTDSFELIESLQEWIGESRILLLSIISIYLSRFEDFPILKLQLEKVDYESRSRNTIRELGKIMRCRSSPTERRGKGNFKR
jgi:hypothetical protein